MVQNRDTVGDVDVLNAVKRTLYEYDAAEKDKEKSIVTVWLAFQVYEQHPPTPEDIIVVSRHFQKLMKVLRKRADDENLILSTTANPMFHREFRKQDNSIHSYIAIKEYHVL